MLKIALLQTDSSHAKEYQIVSQKYNECKIVSLWGEDYNITKNLALDNVIAHKNIHDATKNVDGIMICGRWGDSHFKIAEQVANLNIPVYIDKPMTNSGSEALKLFNLFEHNSTPLFSASPFRFCEELYDLKKLLDGHYPVSGSFTGLGQWHDFGEKGKKIHFYSIHTMELITAIFGTGIKKVFTNHNDKISCSTLCYEDNRFINLNLIMIGEERYSSEIITKDKNFRLNIDPYGNYYYKTFEKLIEFFKNKISPISPEETIQNIQVLDAIEISHKKLNKWINI